MKKTVYIHIGTHKTGTTAVQKFSAENSTELLELGIYYPTISRPTINKISVGHHLLPWYIINHPVPGTFYGEYDKKREFLFPELISNINSSACNHIVLSSEEFDRLNENEIKKLREYFKEFNVKIIIYLRRKDSYIESMYQTDVVYNNYDNTISEYMKVMTMPQNYYQFVKNWQDVFAIENVNINFYCKKALKSNDIIVDFYDKIGFNIEDILNEPEKRAINSSVPFQYVASIVMLRRMNASNDIINSVRRLAYKMEKYVNKDYHFLTLDERTKLADSGLEETKQLNLTLPYDKCMTISDEEKEKNTLNGKYSALKQVFKDFEDYISMQNK